MKPTISHTNIDTTVDKNFSSIREVLCSGIQLDNFNFQIMSGTTADSPDTQKLFIHSMNPPPGGWFPLVGDVYIQGMDGKYVDVRSTKPGVNFNILLIGGLAPATTSYNGPATGIGNASGTSTGTAGIGDINYKSTVTVIEENIPDIIINTLLPTRIETKALNPAFANSNVSTGTQLTDGNYFYTPMTNSNRILKFNRSTGATTNLQLVDLVNAGPTTLKNNVLYIAAQVGLAGSMGIVVVDPDTLTKTLLITVASALIDVNTGFLDIYCDGTHVYVTGSDTGNRYPILIKSTIDGTVSSVIRLDPTLAIQNQGSCKIVDDGTNLWLTSVSIGASVTFNLYKVVKATLAVTIKTLAGSTAPTSFSSAVILNDKIWMLGGFRITGSAGLSMVEYNPTNDTFTVHPLNQIGPSGASRTWNNMTSTAEGYIFMCTGPGGTTTNSGMVLSRYDPITGNQLTAWYPFYIQENTGFANSNLIYDSINDELTALSGSVSSVDALYYFHPDFSIF